MKVSFFTSAIAPVLKVPSAPKGKQFIHMATAHIDFEEVVLRIKTQRYEPVITSIKENYSELKNSKIPAFTPSGTFRLRWDSDLLSYSGVICLDYDNVESVFLLKKEAELLPYTFCAFYSPSLSGLKVLVRVDTGSDFHLKAYQAVKAWYDKKLGLKSDPKCKNVSRLCFFGYDSDLVYKPQADVFPVLELSDAGQHPEKDGYSQVWHIVPDRDLAAAHKNTVFGYLYDFTLRGNVSYSKSNRNNFIFLFCCNANRYGISMEKAQEFATVIWNQDTDGIALDEITKTVLSAYSHVGEHGKFKMAAFDRMQWI